jgi:alkanesulfonate monooxygenase SsuD/methylene tetrahydromethanopterin reductase-like flavin-dependent oxidoreductase (luciferase family)
MSARVRHVKVGVIVPMSESDGGGRPPAWTAQVAFARHSEEVGADSIWVCDHLLSTPPGRPPEGIHEAWTVVAALAASMKRVEIGQLVTCASFRNPALLAKMAVTADGIAGGRMILGLGSGWDDAEHRAFGYPLDHRVDRLAEALRIIGPLLRGEVVNVNGRYHVARGAKLLPAPEHTIPILVAAEGPRMLRLTARYADAWNTAWYGPVCRRVRQRLADMAAALDAEGREPLSLRRTVGVFVVDPEAAGALDPDEDCLSGTVDELARALDAYDELGFDDVIVNLYPMTGRSLDRLAGALSLRGLG